MKISQTRRDCTQSPFIPRSHLLVTSVLQCSAWSPLIMTGGDRNQVQLLMQTQVWSVSHMINNTFSNVTTHPGSAWLQWSWDMTYSEHSTHWHIRVFSLEGGWDLDLRPGPETWDLRPETWDLIMMMLCHHSWSLSTLSRMLLKIWSDDIHCFLVDWSDSRMLWLQWRGCEEVFHQLIAFNSLSPDPGLSHYQALITTISTLHIMSPQLNILLTHTCGDIVMKPLTLSWYYVTLAFQCARCAPSNLGKIMFHLW